MIVPSGRWVTLLPISPDKVSSSGGESRLDFFLRRGSAGVVGGLGGISRLLLFACGASSLSDPSRLITSRSGDSLEVSMGSGAEWRHIGS